MTEMNPFMKRLFFWLIIIALSTGGCTRIFQNDQDAQARQALRDLMTIQEQFHQEHHRYAKNLLEIEKYNLKYHTGIVYLEIEKAGKDSYRAIALPAESITARVFAYDTDQGGYYEMGDEEVAKYVLGALNFIRKEQREKAVVDYISAGMIICLFGFGLRMFIRYKEARTGWVWWPYFLSLLPLSLVVAALNHIDKNIFFSPLLLGLMGAGVGVSVICAILAGIGISKIPETGGQSILRGIAVCAIFISLFSGLVTVYSYTTYSQPDTTNTLYFK